MLAQIIENTNRFMSSVSKDKRKKYGQFFTNMSTANFMASLFNFDLSKPNINILDAGAGTGILSASVVQRLIDNGYQGHINITCYETDKNVLPLLKENMSFIVERTNTSCTIKEENYITSQTFTIGSLFKGNENFYDYIIGNPPYLKMQKNSNEAKVMSEICYGAPNLYFLFLAMGIYNLKQNQELVYIIPRSWTSGAYFKKFREYLFNNCIITDIHLFDSRDKVFNGDSVLQETIIIKIKKTRITPKYINITKSSTSDFSDLKKFRALYDTIISKDKIVFLVTNEEEANVLNIINQFHTTLPQIGLKMRTGIIVDFRTREVLRNTLESGAYPLLYSQHIKNGKVIWPLGKDGEVIKTEKNAYLQENSDYILVKRFTSKEEERRLQCGIYLKQCYSQFKYISTQNKVNFIKCDSPYIAYGLFVLLNSTLYDSYYRIMNGSTQVNSTEINQIPIPEKTIIEKMGKELITKELSVENCNKILSKWTN